jgi:hypothetical protein
MLFLLDRLGESARHGSPEQVHLLIYPISQLLIVLRPRAIVRPHLRELVGSPVFGIVGRRRQHVRREMSREDDRVRVEVDGFFADMAHFGARFLSSF